MFFNILIKNDEDTKKLLKIDLIHMDDQARLDEQRIALKGQNLFTNDEKRPSSCLTLIKSSA